MPEITDEIERELDDLQRRSEERRQELREIAAQLPATMSRRALLRAAVVDFRHAPAKGDIGIRAVRKLARVPRRAFRDVRHALRRLRQ